MRGIHIENGENSIKMGESCIEIWQTCNGMWEKCRQMRGDQAMTAEELLRKYQKVYGEMSSRMTTSMCCGKFGAIRLDGCTPSTVYNGRLLPWISAKSTMCILCFEKIHFRKGNGGILSELVWNDKGENHPCDRR